MRANWAKLAAALAYSLRSFQIRPRPSYAMVRLGVERDRLLVVGQGFIGLEVLLPLDPARDVRVGFFRGEADGFVEIGDGLRVLALPRPGGAPEEEMEPILRVEPDRRRVIRDRLLRLMLLGPRPGPPHINIGVPGIEVDGRCEVHDGPVEFAASPARRRPECDSRSRIFGSSLMAASQSAMTLKRSPFCRQQSARWE